MMRGILLALVMSVALWGGGLLASAQAGKVQKTPVSSSSAPLGYNDENLLGKGNTLTKKRIPPECKGKAEGAALRYCVQFQEGVMGNKAVAGKNGIDLFTNYIALIYKYAASIIGIICVLIIVISGVQISFGGANSELVNQGKERIMQAIFSLALLFLSALILKAINPGFFF